MNLEKQQRKSYGIHTEFLLTLARGQSAMDLHLVSKLLSRNLGETEIGGTDLGMYLVMESVSGITTLKKLHCCHSQALERQHMMRRQQNTALNTIILVFA